MGDGAWIDLSKKRIIFQPGAKRQERPFELGMQTWELREPNEPLAAPREFSMPERIQLVEHLWRITFADGRLDLYEDHYVRKIAHLLYVPNTQSMLARNRARALAD